jgi:octaprenyl-diphosphate synthase
VSALSVKQLFAPIAADMQAVDAVIRARLHSDVALIRQVADYIVQSGGKRLRPALVLFTAGAMGYEGTHHHELAAVVEFIHTASLLHDDVVDESDLRRGNKTASAIYGNAAAVFVGDFMYSRAFQMMVGVDSMKVMRVLAEATNVIAEGEVLQLLNCHNAEVVIDDYLRVIRYKTAKLFEAADDATQARLAAFGMHLGTAFQLIDDVLDYSADEADTGKHLGDYLAEGKPTLPLIHVMQHGTPAQAALVRGAIEHGGRDDFAAVLAAIQDSGALAETRRYAQAEAQRAIDAISVLPPSNIKDALLQLSDFAVRRKH